MNYEIIRGPFLLMETVAVIYKYVNGLSYQSAISRQRFFMNNPTYMAQSKKMARLQQIMEEVCAGLDAGDPRLQHYFAQTGTDTEGICLAQLMTQRFCTLRQQELRKNAEEICAIWQDLLERGYWLGAAHGENLAFVFTKGPGCPGDLFMQIKALPFPGEFQMKMYESFRDFSASMEELVQLIEPVSRALETVFRRESDLFREAEEYWDKAFREKDIREFVATFTDGSFLDKMSNTTRVAVLMMDSNVLSATAADSYLKLGHNALYIGCAIPSNGLPRNRGGDLETVGAMLKCISDKKRLEILRRLSTERSYGLELAEIMGMDSGHMSRILSQMHGYGFLREEKDRLRVYYRTDRETLHSFLELVEATIFAT